MNEKFYHLPEERQERIINAAMEVFSKTSYKNAATDDMIKLAGISKGLLFHYFENKKTLYTYIYDFSVHYINLELKANISEDVTGYFDIIAGIERTFLDVSKTYPFLRHLITQCQNETNEELLADTAACRKLWADTLGGFLGKADDTIFGDEKDVFMDIIGLTLDGVIAKHTKYSQTAYDEIIKYLAFFKNLLPKQ